MNLSLLRHVALLFLMAPSIPAHSINAAVPWQIGLECRRVRRATEQRKGVTVIFITTYRVRQLSKHESKDLMGVFSDKGLASTVKGHVCGRGRQPGMATGTS